MLEVELQRLRDDNLAIAALPLPPEPPFQVLADVTALQDHVYALARRVGSMKREIRDRILQQALAADLSPQREDISEAVRLGL
ncbi:hypothetical protein [Microvirga tunisiensis]|uniref:Uncharacterized protein n=1 Tax=Microvirga tunisiensis TaxID=2108360 RepID=A0A5N7MTW9_9HYPH|nr:hypothetical protein [Microvirga tunisiensis]MPR12584.1 hypothetical protein [Microvirga tunisiensis]MPR27486.1 hypothetical protein [Microvirga tunisiensis]